MKEYKKQKHMPTWNSLKRRLRMWILTNTRIDLKWPTTNKKQPETTYNELETTWNDLQRARNDLKQPTTSKMLPTMTWPYLQWAKKRHETTNNKQIFRLFYNMGQYVLFCKTSTHTFGCNHLNVASWRIMVKTEHQASIIMRQASIIFFMGYKIYYFLSGLCVFILDYYIIYLGQIPYKRKLS